MIAVLAVVSMILGLIVTTIIWGMTRDIDEEDGKLTCRVHGGRDVSGSVFP